MKVSCVPLFPAQECSQLSGRAGGGTQMARAESLEHVCGTKIVESGTLSGIRGD